MHFEQVTMEGYKFTITLTVKLTRYEKYEKKKKKTVFKLKHWLFYFVLFSFWIIIGLLIVFQTIYFFIYFRLFIS